MRYKLLIEYDGSPFCGWQSQQGGGAVQDALADAIEKFCGMRIIPQGAGRTDAGVHARGQVAHFDLEDAAAHPPAKVRDAINYHLKPQPVAILQASEAAPDFDARFSATRRHYLYYIIARRAPLALDAAQAWHVPQPLDIDAMQAAAKYLIGQHDFTSFRSAHCQAKSPIKTLDALEVNGDIVLDEAHAPIEGQVIEITAHARSFLHHQMRSIAGCLKAVGEGKWDAQDVKAALEARDRARCATVAPASGLTLTQVDY